MNTKERNAHWENIYQNKALTEVSWYEPKPETSLKFIESLAPDRKSKIIDVGGGDSLLVDHLLEKGYTNITVLDISEKAIERAKSRLGANANKINWIVADASTYIPSETFDLWHDRAAFHFLIEENEIHHYLKSVSQHLSPSGTFVLGTFSDEGPNKCSGLNIQQYSENHMTELLGNYFQKIRCEKTNHHTPFNTIQNFIFCSFKSKPN